MFPEPDKLDLPRENAGSRSGSATAGTSASGSSWPAPRCRSCSRPCCAAFRRCGLAIPFEEIPFKDDRLAYGVYSLPCAW